MMSITQNPEIQQPLVPNLIALTALPQHSAYKNWLKMSTLRHWVASAQRPGIQADGTPRPSNGFKSCLVRIGGRIYVDLDAFAAWLASNRVTGV